MNHHLEITDIPRQLIYKEKSRNEFMTGKNSINQMLMDYITTQLKQNHCASKKALEKLPAMLLNDAYYITIMIHIDLFDSIDINSIRKIVDGKRPPIKNPQIYDSLLYSVICFFLESILLDLNENEIPPVMNNLIVYASHYENLNKKLAHVNRPKDYDFTPATLSEKLLSKIDWKSLTSNFNLSDISTLLQILGRSSKDLIILINSIFRALIKSSTDGIIRAGVFHYLNSTYTSNGGKEDTLFDIYRSEMKANKAIEPLSRIIQLEKDRLSLVNDIVQLKSVISVDKGKIENLEKRLNKQTKKHEMLATSEAEHRENEAKLQQQLESMNEMVNKVTAKIGSEAILLKDIIDGIKKKADLRGLDKACDYFEIINSVLYDVPVWRENKSELERFFAEERKRINRGQIIEKVEQQTIIHHVGNYNEKVEEQNNQFPVQPIADNDQKKIE